MIQSSTELGRLVARARRHRKLTQAQLARELHVSQPWISEIESGKESARLGAVLRLLTYLGVRLTVAEAPWMPNAANDPPESPPGVISLDAVLSRHSKNPDRRK
jgi:y4mF family transcriptional regulator